MTAPLPEDGRGRSADGGRYEWLADRHFDGLLDRAESVEMIFADAAGRDLGQAERHFLRAGSAVNEFAEGRIAAEAPAGTMAVPWQVLLNASGLPTGSIVVDDAALAIAGE